MSDAKSTHVGSGPLPTIKNSLKSDLISGFLVFLIALPLCLGISLACGYPAIAGVFTAIIGGVLCTFISNSELTIKGPAAGLIVIAIGCVQAFGYERGGDPEVNLQAYRMALAVGVAAGVIQIIFALLRSGVLGEFFPSAAVHGMLAAIGVIIAGKQLHVVLGVTPEAKEPLHQIAELPHSLMNLNPEIAIVGIISLLILFLLPLVRNPWIRRIPAPMLVVVVAVPLGMYFDLSHEHTYSMSGHNYSLGPKFLVDVPMNMFAAMTTPDFSALKTTTGWWYVTLFALIGSLESILSAKAIDTIDPWRRKTNLDRDLLAVGVGNTISAFVGGLPMISEIVRSKANIDNGARTRMADCFHGLFLLAFVALVPGLIHQIPLAALAAMLTYTGFRLASPREFVHAYQTGKGELIVFVATLVGVLATDLLVGIGIGIGVELLLQAWHGAPLLSFLRPGVEIAQRDSGTYVVSVHDSAVFSNWLMLRKHLRELDGANEVELNLENTRFVDHTVMQKLHELQDEMRQRERSLVITGLDDHRSLSEHPHSGRKKVRSK